MYISAILIVIGWALLGALMGLLARGLFVVHRRVGMAAALGSGMAGALAGGFSTNLAVHERLVTATNEGWAGALAGVLVALAILALVTTHRSRTAKLR